MLRKTKKPPEGTKIEKPEDKAWKEWYNGLDVKEHEKHLTQLGLDKEDIEEWEEVEGYKEPSESPDAVREEDEKAPVKKKKK